MIKYAVTAIAVFVLALTLISCGGNASEHEGHEGHEGHTQNTDPRDKEIMDLHDEVMPKTENILQKRQAIKKKIEEYKTTVDSVKIEGLKKLDEELEDANDAMDNWMNTYAPPEKATKEQLDEFYAAEKKKIIEVKQKILTALQKAEEAVK